MHGKCVSDPVHRWSRYHDSPFTARFVCSCCILVRIWFSILALTYIMAHPCTSFLIRQARFAVRRGHAVTRACPWIGLRTGEAVSACLSTTSQLNTIRFKGGLNDFLSTSTHVKSRGPPTDALADQLSGETRCAREPNYCVPLCMPLLKIVFTFTGRF
jgi:hypothetical protein